jgi:hypothetical protein
VYHGVIAKEFRGIQTRRPTEATRLNAKVKVGKSGPNARFRDKFSTEAATAKKRAAKYVPASQYGQTNTAKAHPTKYEL